jgi:phosphatidylglycerophosphatase C
VIVTICTATGQICKEAALNLETANPTQRPVALFDVDKTITTQDTLLLLIKTSLAKAPWRAVFYVLASPLFFSTFLFRLDRGVAKGASLWAVTVLRDKESVLQQWQTLIRAQSASLLLPQALAEIQSLRQKGFEIVFVTASAPEWIAPLLQEAGCGKDSLIGTHLRWRWGGFTVVGKNCFSEEKVRRLRLELPKLGIWKKGYSDSYADAPMLELCQERFLISPTKPHLSRYLKRLGENSFKVFRWRA